MLLILACQRPTQLNPTHPVVRSLSFSIFPSRPPSAPSSAGGVGVMDEETMGKTNGEVSPHGVDVGGGDG